GFAPMSADSEKFQPVSIGDDNGFEPFGITFSASPTHLMVQRPLTRQEAASEAVSEVETSLDGLDNHPNLFVMVGACAVAVPLSLFKQGAAMFQGLSSKELTAAAANIEKAAAGSQANKELATQVARGVSPDLPHALVAKHSAPSPEWAGENSRMMLEISVE